MMQSNFLDMPDQTKRYWTVTSITHHIKDWIDSNVWLQDCWIQGEISNLSRPSSGHIYFTLKDSSAQLRCVIWRTQASRLRVQLQDGQQIEAHGAVTVYEATGQYQLIADSIQLSGEGQLYQEFMRLKTRLEAEGLFDSATKRPLPEYPTRIGLVTSPSGAALQDMLNTIQRRFPLAEVILSPAIVQGTESPASILKALGLLFSQPQPPDVIILARGGGSLEDLWAFNDEQVVRMVADSPIPIVTGVGHETDTTLVDYAADLRAATPTAAAERATPNQADLRAYHAGLALRQDEILHQLMTGERNALKTQIFRLDRMSPQARIQADRQTIDNRLHSALQSSVHTLQLAGSQLQGIFARLKAVNPLAVLDRGYALVTDQRSGVIIHSIGQTVPDQPINLRVSDGNIFARVMDKTGES